MYMCREDRYLLLDADDNSDLGFKVAWDKYAGQSGNRVKWHPCLYHLYNSSQKQNREHQSALNIILDHTVGTQFDLGILASHWAESCPLLKGNLCQEIQVPMPFFVVELHFGTTLLCDILSQPN